MLIGHQKIWQFLKKSAELGKISHAYLFFGPEKVGKKQVALRWARSLLQDEKKDNKQYWHPDLILLMPQNEEISIYQIRELIAKLSLKPYSAPLKVAIIDQAHLMNQEAQNCFLKTLEEPKEKTLLILITEYPELLLPTIVSRCQIIKFHHVPNKEIEEYLRKEKIEEIKIKEILKICMGKPGLAMDFEKIKDWQEDIKIINKIFVSDLADRFQYAKELSEKNNLKEILEVWTHYLRRILFEKIKQKDFSSLTRLKKIIGKIQEINFLISTTNINQKLALEILMLEFN